jgi:hypothetical protein
MKTKWKQIKGFEDKYRISSEGEVQNLKTGKYLKASKMKNGYYKVTLIEAIWSAWQPKKVTENHQYILHRLVAKHFIPNPDNKPKVTHIDGDYSNNKVSNLKWVTEKEVGGSIAKALVHSSRRGENHQGTKLSKKDAEAIKQNVDLLSKKKLANIYGVSEITIAKIRNGSHWSSK